MKSKVLNRLIKLATINAKRVHASFGLRYILANMEDLRSVTRLEEYEIKQGAGEIAEGLLEGGPEIIGLGVYIWNVELSLAVISILKRVRPAVVIVGGGPELRSGAETNPKYGNFDHLIFGEADLKFGEVCRELLAGGSLPRGIPSGLPDLKALCSPYDEYTPEDCRYRLIYVEASRGCPFSCEFCLSSLDEAVREFDMEDFLKSMQSLLRRGVRRFKFVDRTFNLKMKTACSILEFFLGQLKEHEFEVHFELVPDRLPDSIKTWIEKFPPGIVQFEIGIQSFSDEVGRLIQRRMNTEQSVQNLRYLKASTQVHLHVDLIIGLPGETWDSLKDSMDRLWHLHPHEIQIGILKNLKGTPISRHAQEWSMVFGELPPYEILSHKNFDFATLQRLKRMAKYFEIYSNSGRFELGLNLLVEEFEGSAFDGFMAFSDWLWCEKRTDHGISLQHQLQYVHEYLCGERAVAPERVLDALVSDFLNPQLNRQNSMKSLPQFMSVAVHRRVNVRQPLATP